MVALVTSASAVSPTGCCTTAASSFGAWAMSTGGAALLLWRFLCAIGLALPSAACLAPAHATGSQLACIRCTPSMRFPPHSQRIRTRPSDPAETEVLIVLQYLVTAA